MEIECGLIEFESVSIDSMNVNSTMTDCPFCTESMTWSNVLQCVRMELFPAISVKISECVQEKLLMDSSFKMTNIGKEAVMDVIERLKEKRTMNNVELSYLLRLFDRANDPFKGLSVDYHLLLAAELTIWIALLDFLLI